MRFRERALAMILLAGCLLCLAALGNSADAPIARQLAEVDKVNVQGD